MNIESPWIVRDSDDNVITELDWGTNPYDDVLLKKLYFEYRGIKPIKILGFYLRDMPYESYEGEQGPILDKQEVIRWGDECLDAGLSITQVDAETGMESEKKFFSGQGDIEATAIEYIGHTDSILKIDQRMKVILKLIAPDAARKEILKARKFHITLDISYIEIPDRIQDLIIPDEVL